MSPSWLDRSKLTGPQLALGAGLLAGAVSLAYLARARAHWPWFAVWLALLLATLAVLSLPTVRRSFNLSWFGVTLLTLTGVSAANMFLIHVETHRQRSERLEVLGAYLEPGPDPLAVGVGFGGLDVHLEGDPYRLERWSVSVEPDAGAGFRITDAQNVEMLRVRRGGGWRPWAGGLTSVLGRTLTRGAPITLPDRADGEPELALTPEGKRGTLVWGDARARLSLPDPLLDRVLGRSLGQGVQLAELDWDRPVDRERAEDLVLTLVTPSRELGRLRLTLPTYRVVSRRSPDLGDGIPVEAGDTLWIRSRGGSWAFALDHVPEVSRVASPTAVLFVRRPRPTGWAMPSAEACGANVNRCGIISSGPLPSPQAHFDLSGFGLAAERYGVTARLETDGDQVRVVSADDAVEFEFGRTVPIAARPLDGDDFGAGYLVRAHRASTAGRAAVFLTVLGLYVMFVSALLILLGNTQLATRLRADSPSTSAAWALLNLFLIFLGVRLALGLRVAYAAPFYDRAAATSVGLWIAFAIMLVLLGRWESWTPTFWRAVRRLERPVTRMLGPGGQAPAPSDAATVDAPRAPRRDRLMAGVGILGFALSTSALVWQRPEAGLGVIVAGIGVGAWLTMGLFGGYRSVATRPGGPLAVLTSDALTAQPSRTFLVAAATAVVLALAIQAPITALVPVVGLLALLGAAYSLERTESLRGPGARAWTLYGAVVVAAGLATWVFLGFGPVPAAGWALASTGGALALARTNGSAGRSHLLSWYDALLDTGRAAFGGLGGVAVLGGLGLLAFLNSRDIPPFVRFALVFLLFLLAVRAGLVCRRVLDERKRGSSVAALGLLVIPVGVLLVFMLFDFGLGLVFFVPMMATVLLAAGIDRLGTTLTLGSLGLLGAVLLAALSVLRPSVADLREAATVAEFSQEFGTIGNGFVDLLRTAGLETPVTRATVRSVAASHPELVEEALAFAGPSEALFAAAPSLEQVWGGSAYAASGWTGTGLAGMTALGRGVPTVVSYAENTFSVYVLSEHGALGGLLVLLAYLGLLLPVGIWIVRSRGRVGREPAGLAVLAITVGGVLWLTLPAAYVAASNLAMLPLTGQNMPFLGLNSWADVVLVSGIGTGVFVSLAGLTLGNGAQS